MNADYTNSYNIWKVSTEGDCEGRTTKNLGYWQGYVDTIAFELADKCEYSLRFEPLEINRISCKPSTSKKVNISFGIDSGTWDMTNEEQVKWAKDFLTNGRYIPDIEVEPCSYYAAVTLIKDTELIKKNRIKKEALSKLTEEEKEVLGLLE